MRKQKYDENFPFFLDPETWKELGVLSEKNDDTMTGLCRKAFVHGIEIVNDPGFTVSDDRPSYKTRKSMVVPVVTSVSEFYRSAAERLNVDLSSLLRHVIVLYLAKN